MEKKYNLLTPKQRKAARVAEIALQQVLGWKLVPVEPTPEMVSAAEEAHMPFGDMDIALRMAILSAPSAPAPANPAGQWVAVSERLPKSGVTVIAHYASGLICTTRRNVLEFDIASPEPSYGERDRPTHWMPLPKSPEAGQ